MQRCCICCNRRFGWCGRQSSAARVQYADRVQCAGWFALESCGSVEVAGDEVRGGVVFDAGKPEGVQLCGDVVGCEVAEQGFTDAGQPIGTCPLVRTVLVGGGRLQVVEDHLDRLGLTSYVLEGGVGGVRGQVEDDAEPHEYGRV